MRNDILLRSQYLNNILHQRIPYLESTVDGLYGQYINTERKLKSTDIIKIKISFGSGNNAFVAFGVRRQGSATDGKHMYISCYSNYFVVACGDNINNNKHYTFSSYNDIFEIEFNPNEKYVKVNGVIDESLNDADFSLPYINGDTKYEAYLFTGNNIGTPWSGCNCRIYDYAVYDNNGICVQHLIPIIYRNTLCMVDMISNNIFYNQRTIYDFKYVDKYNNILIPYLKADGKNYLIIDYQPNINTKLYIKYVIPSSSNHQIVFDATNWKISTNNRVNRFTYVASKNGNWLALGDIPNGAPNISANAEYKNYIYIDVNKSQCTTPTGTKNLYPDCDISGLVSTDNLHIFHRGDNNTIASSVHIHDIQIYENDKLLYNLQPFDDGVNNGLINIIDGTKYTSVTGGRFS